MAKTAIVGVDGSNQSKINPLVENVTRTWGNARTFLSDVRAETRKVVTPSRKEVQATTTVVLVTVFIFAGYFALVDYIFSSGLAVLMNKLVGPQ